jgi:hypothetical protein
LHHGILFRRGVFRRRLGYRDQFRRSTNGAYAAWSAHFGSRHPSTWSNSGSKSVRNGAARSSAGAHHNVQWEHGGSATWRDGNKSCWKRTELLLLSGRVHRHDVWKDRAWYVLLLDQLRAGLHYSHTDVLHDCSKGVSIRAVPSPIRAADGLHDDNRDDTVLLHGPEILLYAHDVRVPDHDRASGYRHGRGYFTRGGGSGVYAHDVHGSERGIAHDINTAIWHDSIGHATAVGSDFIEWYDSIADGPAATARESQVIGSQAVGAWLAGSRSGSAAEVV